MIISPPPPKTHLIYLSAKVTHSPLHRKQFAELRCSNICQI